MRNDLLKHNLIETVLPFCNYDNLEVKSKALSIIRLMVKNCNQTNGLDLIFEKKSFEIIERIATNPGDHPIIVGESSRLVCYLPIAAKSEINIEKICQHKFIPIICNQLSSEHLIMLNEALLALNVIVTISYSNLQLFYFIFYNFITNFNILGAAFEQLKESSLNENLKKCLSKEKIPLEMILNALKLFEFIFEKRKYF